MKRFLIGLAVVTLLLTGWWFVSRTMIEPSAGLPAANTTANRNTNHVVQNTNTTNTVVTNTPIVLPPSITLAVPFMSQAPSANWDADHEEFCEEAAVFMAASYFSGTKTLSVTAAEAALQDIKEWELNHLGFYFDTTAAETKQLFEEKFKLDIELVENPTVTDLKEALAQRYVVIVPTNGRLLGNPNFTGLGPVYHNLVVRGYNQKDQFITNDPGTRKGNAYVYKTSVVMNAMHDWVPNGSRTIAANGAATGTPTVLIVKGKL